MNNDPLNAKFLKVNLMERPPSKPLPYLKFLSKALKTVPKMLPWLVKHSKKVTNPNIIHVLAALRDPTGDFKADKVGVVGFCFGAKYSIRTSHPNMHSGVPQTDAFVACHPGTISVPSDIQHISKPGLFVLADFDRTFNEKIEKRVRGIVKRDGKLNGLVEFRKYEGTVHGFACRCDDMDDATRQMRDRALQDIVEFFGTVL
jgi:dienelactone hydrolase